MINAFCARFVGIVLCRVTGIMAESAGQGLFGDSFADWLELGKGVPLFNFLQVCCCQSQPEDAKVPKVPNKI